MADPLIDDGNMVQGLPDQNNPGLLADGRILAGYIDGHGVAHELPVDENGRAILADLVAHNNPRGFAAALLADNNGIWDENAARRVLKPGQLQHLLLDVGNAHGVQAGMADDNNLDWAANAMFNHLSPGRAQHILINRQILLDDAVLRRQGGVYAIEDRPLPNFLAHMETVRPDLMDGTGAEKSKFAKLWTIHLEQLHNGTLVYCLPEELGSKLYANGRLFDICVALALTTEKNYRIIHNERELYFIVQPASTLVEEFCVVFQEAPYIAEAPVAGPRGVRLAKPRNMWLIFLGLWYEIVRANNPHLHTSEISKIVAGMWKELGPEDKLVFKQLADKEKAEHAERNPGYKCAPRKSSEIKRRKSAKAAQAPVAAEEAEVNDVAAELEPVQHESRLAAVLAQVQQLEESIEDDLEGFEANYQVARTCRGN